jgi:hypothetical protein
MQMAQSKRNLEMILGEADHSALARMYALLWIDFLFIGAYWLALVSVCLYSLNGSISLAQVLGVLLVLCTTLTAFFDVRENMAILKVLASLRAPVGQNEARLLRAVNFAALAKWRLFSVTMILLCVFLLQWTDFRTVTGFVLLLSSLLFLATSGAAAIGAWRRDAVLELTASPMGLGLILLVSVLFFSPSVFL